MPGGVGRGLSTCHFLALCLVEPRINLDTVKQELLLLQVISPEQETFLPRLPNIASQPHRCQFPEREGVASWFEVLTLAMAISGRAAACAALVFPSTATTRLPSTISANPRAR